MHQKTKERMGQYRRVGWYKCSYEMCGHDESGLEGKQESRN